MDIFERYAQHVPLELFVFAGSFIEEVISPIPSFAVLIPAGVAAEVQTLPVWYLPLLAVLASSGRLLGAMLLYWLADKFEDVLLGNGQRFFGASHEAVERFGHRLRRDSDWRALFVLNAVPVIPVALLSVTCGFIKLPFRIFVSATFFGTIISALFYLILGYAGYGAAAVFRELELLSQLAMAALLIVVLWWMYRRRTKQRSKNNKNSA